MLPAFFVLLNTLSEIYSGYNYFMVKSSQTKAMIYANRTTIFFLADSVIKEGLLRVEDDKKQVIFEDTTINSNYTHVSLPAKIIKGSKYFVVTFFSKDINMQKKIYLK